MLATIEIAVEIGIEIESQYPVGFRDADTDCIDHQKTFLHTIDPARWISRERLFRGIVVTEVTIYTDGGSHGNPGPGGYGVVLIYGEHRKELSGAYRRTTNNRMELRACIVGLEALKKPCKVILHSDSKYIVDGMTRGWARRWRANDWKRNRTERAINPDLWERLLDLCDKHDVTFRWVRGHAGHPENERCDNLVKEAIARGHLAEDGGYEGRNWKPET